MAAWRGPRGVFLDFIGVLAASLASAGVHLSNNEFNGRRIKQFQSSKLLTDDMIIRRFYIYETLIHHNFVVFQTDSGQTFKVHLIADVDPGHYSPIYVKIVPSYWRPSGKHVRRSHKLAGDLKFFVKQEVRRFGNYEVGHNDCRHFAQAVAAFLAGRSSYKPWQTPMT